MLFQKTFLYKNEACPPRDKIVGIANGSDLTVLTKTNEEITAYIIQCELSAFDLIQVVIAIMKEFPFNEFPFEEDIDDFSMECGKPVYQPEDLN